MKAVKYQKKSLIKLENLLRRRKTTLSKFLQERGITTYQALESVCSRLGVVTPSLEAFNLCIPSYVSDPTDGVIVVPPLDIVNEATGEKEDVGDVFVAISPGSSYEISMMDDDEQASGSADVVDVRNFSRKKNKRAVG
jgi:hypothetical protein